MRRSTALNHKQLSTEQWCSIITEGADKLGMSVSPENARCFAVYAEELLQWNSRINLTAITDPFAIAVNHFLDSIAAAPYIPCSAKLLDIGSGGGFPGIPLKIIKPSLSVFSIDGSRKKISFQRQIIRLLNLTGIEAHHQRAETYHQGWEMFDIVISRALTSLNQFIELAHPFLNSAGTIIALKGKHAKENIEQLPQGFTYQLIGYRLPYTEAERCLILVKHKPLK